MRLNSQAVPVDRRLLPEPDDAVQQFESFGGHLILYSTIGQDPLRDRADLISQRDSDFHAHYPDFGLFFYTVVNGDYSVFRNGLLFLIHTSQQLQAHL